MPQMKDIIWYTRPPGRRSILVTAKASDHENADGQYEAQVFYVIKGQNKFVEKVLITQFQNHSLIWSLQNQKDGTFHHHS